MLICWRDVGGRTRWSWKRKGPTTDSSRSSLRNGYAIAHLIFRSVVMLTVPAQGTYLGTLEGVNHLELIGWVNTARYKWAEIMGREVKFKPVTFYLGIADHLARVVEGQEHAPGDAAGSSGERAETRREGERAAMADSLDKGGSFMSKRGESEERGRRH